VTSYSNAELKTFHCEKVRKMPLSGLDPSMLLGFLCRDVREWEELRKGVEEVSVINLKFIFFSSR
jgi:cysteine protease ATG4